MEASNFGQVMGALRNISSGTLIALDCDNVIISRKDKILKPPSRTIYDQLMRALRLDLKDQTMRVGNRVIPLAEYLEGIIIRDAQLELVDQRIPSIIANLEKQHSVIALTAGRVGPFSIFDAMEDRRIHQLESLGVCFNGMANDVSQMLEVGDFNPRPLFKKGVLLTAKSSKARSLQALIDRLGKTPPCLVVIDDRSKWIDELFEHFQSHIPIIAIHYQDEKILREIPDESLGQKQFNHLRTSHQWLSDQEMKVFR